MMLRENIGRDAILDKIRLLIVCGGVAVKREDVFVERKKMPPRAVWRPCREVFPVALPIVRFPCIPRV